MIPSPYPNAYEEDGELHFLYRSPSPTANGTGSSAEDADTVFHELGHLLLSRSQPALTGEWRNAIHEGTAMIVTALVQPEDVPTANRACEGEWIVSYYEGSGLVEVKNHEGFPCLRILDHDRTLEDAEPGDVRFANQLQYARGEILAGAVFDLGQQIGWNETLELYLEAMYSFPENPDGFEDVGEAMVRADCALTNCSDVEAIQAAFGAHEIEVQAPEDANVTVEDRTSSDESGNGDSSEAVDDGDSSEKLESASSGDDGLLGVAAVAPVVGLAVLALAALAARRR